jgi:hypothetical protein
MLSTAKWNNVIEHLKTVVKGISDGVRRDMCMTKQYQLFKRGFDVIIMLKCILRIKFEDVRK